MSYLRQIKRQTSTLLAELGKSPDEVAESLLEAGIHGVPKDNSTCAVALYVTALMGSEPRISSISVGHCSLHITMVAPTDHRPAGRLQVQLPKAVRRFVAAFDARQYPMVLREDSGAPVLLETGPPVLREEPGGSKAALADAQR